MGLISRVSSRTYRKSQKHQPIKMAQAEVNKPVGQSPRNTSSSETVSLKPNSTSSSSGNLPRTDTPVSSSENPRPAKSSSSPPDHPRSSVKKLDESESLPPLSTNDGDMNKDRSIFTSNESPTEVSLPSLGPNLSDTNSSAVSPSDEPPTVSFDLSWNKAPEVAKSSSPVKSEASERKV